MAFLHNEVRGVRGHRILHTPQKADTGFRSSRHTSRVGPNPGMDRVQVSTRWLQRVLPVN
ncbi:unnamed protein product [Medioppia subpectinata]|uniref:Uncharacterized protein n=1 Tax=Medioppia subpectinata TaxID=1979941 RepID=A0A7R9LUG7_9ACAR|nr:unnamed protein product [Medioppia subpectinata]CAG2121822.1 unnamed protein product [Medioppia subpectinata]